MKPQPTAIFIPSLSRPARLEQVLRSIHDNTPEGHGVYVVVDQDDLTSQRVCQAHLVRYWMDDAGWYWPRLQFLYEQTFEPWIFIGQDDIVFSPDWLSRCFAHADDTVAVVTPSDGHNPMGTSFLVRRAYIAAHGGHMGFPGRLHHPDYRHNFTDLEFIETAEARGVHARATDVLVEHQHVDWGNAPDDESYQRVRPHWMHDAQLFESRRHLWESV
jgi:cellulose synthase/poly-beta-1,6-N-acetylglucosamine synthase-like glycosyltransferase